MRKGGFTLIEMSIVLLIIGLIVGGILVGNDLIVAAKVRATLLQIEQYTTALNAFKTKYGGLPGDIAASDADDLGLESRAGVTGSGDNNGLIEACNADGASSNTEYLGCENILVWRDLYDAGMVAGNFTLAADAAMVGVSDFSQLLPNAKSFPDTQIHLFSKRINLSLSGSGIPQFSMAYRNMMGMMRFSTTDMSGSVGGSATISPLIAQAMDNKADDGLPLSGRIMGLSAISGWYNLLTPPAVCYYNGSAPNAYPVNPTYRDSLICKMLFIL